jgi:two-component sensor histidine kinase
MEDISFSELAIWAELNLKACRKAKTSNAYDTALEFADKGISLLGKSTWDDNYSLYRDLSMEKAECSYLVGDFAQAESIVAIVLDKVRTNEEKALVHNLKSIIYALHGDLIGSVRAGLSGLNELGVNISERPNKVNVGLEFTRAFLRLRGRKPEDLLNLPEMTDDKQRLVINIIMNTISSAYLTNRNLFEFLCLRGFNLTLQYGLTESSPYMLHSYAFALANIFGSYNNAYDFGNTAFSLNDKIPNAQMRSKITAMFGFFFSHWCKPLLEGIKYVKQGFRYTVETGDLVFAGYSSCTLALYMITQGKNIDEILTEIKTYQNFTSQSEDQFSIDWFSLMNQFFKNLKDRTDSRSSLSDDTYDEESSVQSYKEQHNANILFHYCLWKGVVLFLHGYKEEACRLLEEGKSFEHGVALLPSVGDLPFYHSLAMTSAYSGLPIYKRRRFRKLLKRNRARLKKWASGCPDNFEHKYFLVQAETARILGKTMRAIDFYSKAITSARTYGFLQVEALANELLARFQFSFNRKPLGQIYIQESCRCYHKWGSTSKVRALFEEYGFPSLADYAEPERDMREDTSSSSSGSTKQIDLTTVMRASQAISEEIVLDKLLQEILKIAIQNAGASKGFLILQKDDNMFIEAEGFSDTEEVEILQSIPIESSKDLSTGIVNYVRRTKETVVLENASEKGLFISDPHVVDNRTKSILCSPVVKQKELIGILYLENDLLTNAFTQDRLEVLSILAAQAAISIENAKLYKDVEHRVLQLQEAEKKITTSLKEKEILLREIHHRVKNNMQIISSLLRLQSGNITNQDDIGMLKDSQNRIKSMSLVHEKLYGSKDLSHVNFKDYIKELAGVLFQSYETHRGEVRLNISVDEIWLGIDTAIPCGLVINELISNSLKHAFPDKRKGEISISFHKIDEEEFNLRVSDNGIGIPDELDPRSTSSLGLRLLTTLSENQLNGKMRLWKNKGTEFELIFKEIKYEKRI